MKRQIRIGVFETNSSSEHSVSISEIGGAILTEEEFALYESGELKITPTGEIIKPEDFKVMRELIHEEAGNEWDNHRCKQTWMKVDTRKDYIAYRLNEFEYENDIKRHVIYGDERAFSIETIKREINGKIYYIVAYANAELD